MKLGDLKCEFLRAGFAKNTKKVVNEIRLAKATMSAKQYELDMTLAFWFAVHMEDLPTAQALMQEEFLLKQLVACALINKPDDDEDAFDEDMSESEESEQNWEQ